MQILKRFEYFEPTTVKEAAQILSKYGEKAKVLAGGVDLVPCMRKRQVQPECVVCIREIPGLDYIADDEAGLRIGAMATLRTLELSEKVKRAYLLLWEAVHQISSTQVKSMGTAVGNLCVGTPASDVAVALFALGAGLKMVSPGSDRVVPIENFFVGTKKTILQPGEIVSELLLPQPAAGAVGAFMKLGRTASDIAKVSVAVNLVLANNTCKQARVALGAVAPTPIRAKKAEKILAGSGLDQNVIIKAAEVAAEETSPITDVRSTAEYRREVTRVLVRRAINRAMERAKA